MPGSLPFARELARFQNTIKSTPTDVKKIVDAVDTVRMACSRCNWFVDDLLRSVIETVDDPDLVRTLIAAETASSYDWRGHGPVIDVNGGREYSPLMIAAHLNQVETVRVLLENGADQTVCYDKPSYEEEEDDETPFLDWPLDRQVATIYEDGSTAKEWARGPPRCDGELAAFIEGWDTPQCEDLFNKALAVRRWSQIGRFMKGGQRYCEAVRLILDKGDFDVNTRSRIDGEITLLHRAAAMGFSDIARVLLEYGADPTLTDTTGKTAADLFQFFARNEEGAALIRGWTSQKTQRAKKRREEVARKACIKAMTGAQTDFELRAAIERAERIGVGRAAIVNGENRMEDLQANRQKASEWAKRFADAQTATDLKSALVSANQWRFDHIILPHMNMDGTFIRLRDLLIRDLDDAESEEEIRAAIDLVLGKYSIDEAASIWSVLPNPKRPSTDFCLFTSCGPSDQFLAVVDEDGKLTAALNRARSQLEESQALRQHEAERKAASVDVLMPERPTEHLCAITQQPMRHPVVADDGFTYERSAIERWLRSNSTSPKTNEPLANKTLRPNMDLKSLIRDWEPREHARCMAQAVPSLARQSTADLEAELARRKGSSSGAPGKRKSESAAAGQRKARK